MRRGAIRLALTGLLAASAAAAPTAEDPGLRLYTLDCGHVRYKDTGLLSDTGDLDGKPGEFAIPCYLVRHAQGWLLWDTGLSDALAARKDGVDAGPSHVWMPVTLAGQLRQLGVASDQITYVAFSHHHADHTGNVGQFTAATWLLSRAELAAAAAGKVPGTIAADKAAHSRMIDNELDVFGDGTARIIATPGHTPGSQSLVLSLAHSGTVILAGDLYASRENRRLRRVPVGNSSRAETLASMDRIERIAKLRHARVIGQHDPQDFNSMPKFPAFLD